MDPAKETPIRSADDMQGVLLGKHEEELSTARLAVEFLVAHVTDLTASMPRNSLEPRINNPPCYSGEPSGFRAFLTQYELVFSLLPITYAKECSRVAFVVSLSLSECCQQFASFKEEMIRYLSFDERPLIN